MSQIGRDERTGGGETGVKQCWGKIDKIGQESGGGPNSIEQNRERGYETVGGLASFGAT